MVVHLEKDDFEVLVAENRFVNDILFEIETALKKLNVSQAELAHALGVSDARVSQILAGNGKNLQARSIARIAYVLGLRPDLGFIDDTVASKLEDQISCRIIQARVKAWATESRDFDGPVWEGPSNDDDQFDEIENHVERAAA